MAKSVATVKEEDIASSGKTQRILAFDLIRGFFLLVIMIDHVELYPSIFSIITGEGRMWVSAAEGFFFLSGLLVGMMYKRRLHLGMKFIFKKMWKRALELYVVGTALTFIFLAWVEFTHHAPIKDALPAPFPWHHDIVQALLMRFTYGWGDFLVRFAILMLIAPFVFFVIAKGKWWLALAGIFVAWWFRGTGFTLAWQLIFNGAMIIGFYWQQIHSWFGGLKPLTRRRIKQTVATAALITFTASWSSVYVLALINHTINHLPTGFHHVSYTWGRLNDDVWRYADKWTMGPVRVVLFALWFSTMYWAVRRYEAKIAHATRGILELLGRNSLFVYTVHSFIVFALKMYLIPENPAIWQNFLITGLGLTVLVLITMGYRNLRTKISGPNPPSINWRSAMRALMPS